MLFFKKKSNQHIKENTDAVAKKGIKKMDALVTGAILWWVVASLYGVRKLKNHKNAIVTEQISQITEKTQEKVHTTLESIKIDTEPKKWFFSQLFHKFFG